MLEFKQFFEPGSKYGRYMVQGSAFRLPSRRCRLWYVVAFDLEEMRFAVVRLSEVVRQCYLGTTKATLRKKCKRLFSVWKSLRARCYNPSRKDYRWYGQKGVVVDDAWLTDFDSFVRWCRTSGHKKGSVLDRVDSSKGYSDDNCRWISRAENARRATAVREQNRRRRKAG